MPARVRLSYALAAAEVMDHFIDHDAHGYSQPNRDGTAETETITLSDGTEVSFQSGDRDCSRLIQTCYVVVGVLPRGLHMWTGNEREILLANGFVEVPLDNLQRGDVLWRAGHTEMYMGGNVEGGARRSETHGIDGRTGDQDGGELDRSQYVRSHWTSAYRCTKVRPDEGRAIEDKNTQSIEESTMTAFFVKLDGDQTEHFWDGKNLHAIANNDEKQAIVMWWKIVHPGQTLDVKPVEFGSPDAPWGARLNDVLSRGANFRTFERFNKHPSLRATVTDVVKTELQRYQVDEDGLAEMIVQKVVDAIG